MSTSLDRGPTPAASVRFYRSRRNSIGTALAVFAGLLNIGVVVWPFVNSVGRGDLDPTWRWIGVLASVAYLSAFFLADTRWNLSRTVLVIGAVVQILAGVTFGRAYDTQSGFSGQLVGLLDFLPAIMALVAAALIHRAPSNAELEQR